MSFTTLFVSFSIFGFTQYSRSRYIWFIIKNNEKICYTCAKSRVYYNIRLSETVNYLDRFSIDPGVENFSWGFSCLS